MHPRTFLPPTGDAALATPPARCLLVGPPVCGVSSLLFQHALNRARNGLTTLVILCGPPEPRPPAKPRAGEADDMNELLRMIFVKQVERWDTLRELLAALHLPSSVPPFAKGLPQGLIIGNLSSLFAPSQATATSSQQQQQQQHTPSPSKPAHHHVAMHLALALALAAHAADLLDQSTAGQPPPQDGAAAPPPPPPPPDGALRPPASLLIVSCSGLSAVEVQTSSRWLPTELRATGGGAQCQLARPRAERDAAQDHGTAWYEYTGPTLRAVEPPSLRSDVPAAALASPRPAPAAMPPPPSRGTPRVTPTAQHPARPRVFVYGASGEGEARISEAAMSG
jgi:hypothetical protein